MNTKWWISSSVEVRYASESQGTREHRDEQFNCYRRYVPGLAARTCTVPKHSLSQFRKSLCVPTDAAARRSIYSKARITTSSGEDYQGRASAVSVVRPPSVPDVELAHAERPIAAIAVGTVSGDASERGSARDRELREQYAEVDDRMKSARRWLVAAGKVPHYTDGRPRGKTDSAEDHSALGTFDDALDALANSGSRFTSLGFALGPDGEGGYWQGIDLDKVSQRSELQYLVSDGLPGYTERSISGSGVHAIGYGRAFATLGSNGSGIEAYCGGRFFVVTGDKAGGSVECIADYVEETLADMRGSLEGSPREVRESQPARQATPEQIADLRSALNFLRPDDYQLWIQVGHALHELGDNGRELWLTWSGHSEKYDSLEATRKWESFQPDRTSFEAVFAVAQRQGWQNPKSAIRSAAGRVPYGIAGDLDAKLVDLREAVDSDKEHPCVIAHILPKGEVSLFAGHGGTGKSFLALVMGIHVALGKDFGPLKVSQCNVCFFSAEDSRETLLSRVAKVCEQMGVPQYALHGRLHILDMSECDPTLYTSDGRAGALTATVDALANFVRDNDIKFVIVDNASDTFAGNEISRREVREFMRGLRARLARADDVAVMLLAHVAKSATPGRRERATPEDYSGSTAWHNSARSRLSLEANEDGSLELRHQKANLGPKAEPLRFVWSRLGLTFFGVSTPAADLAGQALAKHEDDLDSQAREWIWEIIRRRSEEGRPVTTSTTGPSTLFHQIRDERGMPKGLDKRRCNRVVSDLIAGGRIVVDPEHRKGGKARSVYVPAPAEVQGTPMPDLPTDAEAYRGVRDAA